MNEFPYPGLRPFERDETDIFFGREDHTDQLLEKLGHVRFLAVVGPSGCGKSSLVRTGLLAGLEGGLLSHAGIHWRIAEMRPGNHPFANLAHALLEESALGEDYIKHFTNKSEAIASLQATLRRGPRSLHDILPEAQLPPGSQLLLLVDQFEELFRYYQQGEVEETSAFVALLLASYQNPNIYVVITMRSDFIGDCAAFYGLPEAVNKGLYLTPRLNREQLSEAMALPATVFGGEVEPALLNRLLNDAGNDPDLLPIIQHALMRMWDLANKNGSEGEECLLTLKHYEQIGGFKNALSNHADEAYHELTPKQQKIAEILFRNLSERDSSHRDTRRPIQLAEVARLAEVDWTKVAKVVEDFRQPGRSFLTPPLGQPLTPDSVIDISHESLIRQWRRMQNWLTQEAESAELYLRLEETAQRWKHGKAALWRSPELEHALFWHKQAQPTKQWARRYGQDFRLAMDFLVQSEAEQQKEAKALQKRRQMTIVSLVSGLIIAVILSVFALQQKHNAEEQAEIVFTHKLGTQAILAAELPSPANGGIDRGLLMAIQATRIRDNLETQGNLLYILANNPKLDFYLQGYNGWIWDSAFSPNGKYLATAGDNGIEIWDVKNRNLVKTLRGHSNTVNSVIFSPDGRYLASASWDKTVKVWSINGFKIINSFPSRNTRLDSSSHIAFCPNNKCLAISEMETGTVALWNIESRTLIGDLSHGTSVSSIAFSPDNQNIVASGGDDILKLWKVDSQTPIGEFRGCFWNIAFSPNGKQLASTCKNTMTLWDVSTQSAIRQPLEGHTSNIFKVSFSSDGKYLVSTSLDRTMRVWDAKSLLPVGYPLIGHSGWLGSGIFNPKKTQQLVSTSNDGSVIVWEIENRSSIGKVLAKYPNDVSSIAFSPEGKYLAIASNNQIELWNVDSQIPIEKHKISGSRVVFSSNGDYLASSDGNNVKLWEVNSQTLFGTLKHSFKISDIFFSDSQHLISVGNNIVQFWDIDNQIPIGEPLEYSSDIFDNTFSFSDDHQKFASVHETSVELWNIENQNPIGKLSQVDRGFVMNLAFSPNGKLLASAGWDNTVKIWDVESLSLLGQPLRGHNSTVSKVAFSPNGLWFASGDATGAIILWDTENHVLIGQPLTAHSGWVKNIIFSHDGKNMASVGDDHTVMLWDMNPQSWLKKACRKAGRNLTQTEWKRFLGNIPYEKTCLQYPSGIAIAIVNQGQELAREGKVEKALAKFKEALALDSNLNFDPETKAKQIYAPRLVEQGQNLAYDGKLDAAINKLKQALALDSNLNFDPETKAKQSYAAGLVEQGQDLAKDGNIENALSKFKEALAQDSSLNFDPEAKVKQSYAAGLVEQGRNLARKGKLEAAIGRYNVAQVLDSRLNISADDWGTLCWYGSLYGHAAKVMAFCEKAVALAPYNWENRAVRALARALTGNIQGAIEDFQFAIKISNNEEWKQKMQGWVTALEKGENPFTEEVLEGLR